MPLKSNNNQPKEGAKKGRKQGSSFYLKWNLVHGYSETDISLPKP